MNGVRWSDRELEMLEQMVADYPTCRLAGVYNNWASNNGFTVRTRQAVIWAANRRGMGDKATGEWVNTAYICRQLGISFDTPHRWSDKYGIPCYRDGRGRRYFRRAELRRVAQQTPERFAGIPADRLFLLLEDRELANKVAAAHPLRPMAPRPVRAIETGWLYPSVRVAADRVGVVRGSIQRAIRTGGTAAGYHWSYAS